VVATGCNVPRGRARIRSSPGAGAAAAGGSTRRGVTGTRALRSPARPLGAARHACRDVAFDPCTHAPRRHLRARPGAAWAGATPRGRRPPGPSTNAQVLIGQQAAPTPYQNQTRLAVETQLFSSSCGVRDICIGHGAHTLLVLDFRDNRVGWRGLSACDDALKPVDSPAGWNEKGEKMRWCHGTACAA